MIPADPIAQVFTAWIREHGAIPRKLSRVYAPASADEADLHQDMLVQIWRSVPSFRGQAKVSTWIYRVCCHTGLTWRRTERRREARVVPQPESVDAAACSADTPAGAGEQSDLMAALWTAIQALPPAERSLVVLALDGLSYREIAEVIGISENHVGVALTRARRKLANELKEIRHEL